MTEIVKGFRDYTGEEAVKRAVIKEVVKSVLERYGFEPAETPVIEYEDFVKGENNKDEAVSDTYKLKDKGKRKLALRYEFTFQLRRLMKNKKIPYRRFQIGPVFRDEPISENRTRQFTTCEADIVGSQYKDEAELFVVISGILKNLKIPGIIYVNNRKLLNQIISEAGVENKYNKDVIREIDKLDKLPESEVRKNLKKYGASKVVSILKNKASFFEKYPAFYEIKNLVDFCKNYGVKVVFAPYLARGLSYYNGTVFEIKTKSIKESIFGGGAYMFNDVQCVGFGVSLERLMAVTNLKIDIEKYLLVSLDQDKVAIQLAKSLRKRGRITSIFYGKPSKALDYANSYNFNKVIFVGEKEIKSKKFKVKDMKSGRESILKL